MPADVLFNLSGGNSPKRSSVSLNELVNKNQLLSGASFEPFSYQLDRQLSRSQPSARSPAPQESRAPREAHTSPAARNESTNHESGKRLPERSEAREAPANKDRHQPAAQKDQVARKDSHQQERRSNDTSQDAAEKPNDNNDPKRVLSRQQQQNKQVNDHMAKEHRYESDLNRGELSEQQLLDKQVQAAALVEEQLLQQRGLMNNAIEPGAKEMPLGVASFMERIKALIDGMGLTDKIPADKLEKFAEKILHDESLPNANGLDKALAAIEHRINELLTSSEQFENPIHVLLADENIQLKGVEADNADIKQILESLVAMLAPDEALAEEQQSILPSGIETAATTVVAQNASTQINVTDVLKSEQKSEPISPSWAGQLRAFDLKQASAQSGEASAVKPLSADSSDTVSPDDLLVNISDKLAKKGGDKTGDLLLSDSANQSKLADKMLGAEGLLQQKIKQAVEQMKTASETKTESSVARSGSTSSSVAHLTTVIKAAEQTTTSTNTGKAFSTTMQAQLGKANWAPELGHRLMMMIGQKIQVAEIRLDPPDLGPMEVKVRMQQEQAHVVFNSQHAAVREALEQATPRLRELFEQNGLALGDVDVQDQSAQQRQGEESDGETLAGNSDEPAGDESRTEKVEIKTSDRIVDYYA